MDQEYIQSLRYKLQKRVRRVNSSEYQVFHYVLKQFWGFLQDQPILVGIMESIEVQTHLVESDVNRIFDSRDAIVFESELENAVACFLVLKRCVESDDGHAEINVAHNYSHESKYNEILESFKDIFVEPFYDFLDEHLDDSSLLLSLLLKYKHKCEWFQRESLLKMWEADTRRGEKKLAMHLYEYLYDQGINFSIEPASASGEADAVSSQQGEEPLIADVKIFNPGKSKGKDYIAKGFRQVYDYTLDYNEPVGYLVIFKTCEEELKFSLPDSVQSTPFVKHNNKTIFFLVVDVHAYEVSASKRGKLKFVEFTEGDLSGEFNK